MRWLAGISAGTTALDIAQVSVAEPGYFLQNGRRVSADKSGGAGIDRLRPFRGAAHHQHGFPRPGLFLQSS